MRIYCRRYTLKDVLLWSTAKCWEKIFHSSRFNVLADFYIRVLELKFVIIKLRSFLK